MTTLHKSVVNVLTSKFDANVVRNLGTKASEAILGIDTIKGLALTLGEMLVEPSQYKTPKALACGYVSTLGRRHSVSIFGEKR
jgi:glycerol-3-phosphate acyltransferase PlsY